MESKFLMNGYLTHQRKASDLTVMETPLGLMDILDTMSCGMLKTGITQFQGQ